MTWKELKDAVESEGVKDDDEIAYIDVQGAEEPAATRRDSDGAWEIASTY